MSAALGPGVRVYVGWCPDDQVADIDVRCHTGTIVDGPFGPPMLEHFFSDTRPPWFRVAIDRGPCVRCHVSILFPIDDDADELERVDELEAVT